MIDDLLDYLRAIIEGDPGIEPWKSWFEKNASDLADRLTRTEFLDLKVNRIKAIPRILEKFGVAYNSSCRYEYFGVLQGNAVNVVPNCKKPETSPSMED